jgi:small conductance mechanosensitive channel
VSLYAEYLLRRLASIAFYGVVTLGAMLPLAVPSVWGQDAEEVAEESTEPGDEESSADQPISKVEVNPLSRDDDIAARLQRIMVATNWFENPRVQVSEGVVFLEGNATTSERKVAGTVTAKRQSRRSKIPNRSSMKSVWSRTYNWSPTKLSVRLSAGYYT